MEQPLDVLKQYWGYEAFRTPQDEIIRSVLDGHDTLALMPTGGGKSICFQVPALLNEGVTLVISPLIALMKDQVQQLKSRNIIADAIYSGMPFRDIDRIFNNCIYGQNKLLYISPERLQTPYAIEKIRQMPVSLLAVDEAHCISQWGYDFRPAYLGISEFRELHPDVPILALTATATPRVADDIQLRLGFRARNLIKSTFFRSNLSYNALKESDKRRKLIRILQKVQGTAVVYGSTRRQCKELATLLQKEGISCTYYHAGLEKAERDERQDAWIRGQVRVMVATNAFGMGIDQAHVRAVVHMSPPASLEAYFQEAGRAGRDGEKAYSVLLYNPKDVEDLKTQFDLSFPDLPEIKAIYHALGSYLKVAIGALPEESLDFELQHFVSVYGLAVPKVLQTLRILSDNQYLYVSEAVYLPSRLAFTCDRETFYDYTLRHPEKGELLKALLRIYQGVFDNAVSIDEFKLAQFLNRSKTYVVESLHLLHAEGLIQYTPTRDLPQISYLQAREHSDYLQIDMKKVLQLKAWRKEMIDAVGGFLQTEGCRSRFLLSYFGETRSQDCGICDRCLEEKRSKNYNSRFEQIKKQILSSGNQLSGLTLQACTEKYNEFDRKIALDVLVYLADEQIIQWSDNKLVFNS